MNKQRLKQYKIHPKRAKELTGVKAELYVFTFQQLQEVINKNSVSPSVSNSLNLHELERKLDEALGKETSETLTEWLKQKRIIQHKE